MYGRLVFSVSVLTCVVGSVGCTAPIPAPAPTPPVTSGSRDTTCLPPYWAGVLAGSSSEREVTHLLGTGYSTELQGAPVRLYTDPGRSSTLVVTLGTDNIVTGLDLWQALDPALDSSAASQARASTWLRPHDGFGAWGELHLGSTIADVRKNMGKPSSVSSESDLAVLSYSSTCACELDTGLVFRFRNDRLVSFGVWALNG
jgi:hypothetical protein